MPPNVPNYSTKGIAPHPSRVKAETDLAAQRKQERDAKKGWLDQLDEMMFGAKPDVDAYNPLPPTAEEVEAETQDAIDMTEQAGVAVGPDGRPQADYQNVSADFLEGIAMDPSAVSEYLGGGPETGGKLVGMDPAEEARRMREEAARKRAQQPRTSAAHPTGAKPWNPAPQPTQVSRR